VEGALAHCDSETLDPRPGGAPARALRRSKTQRSSISTVRCSAAGPKGRDQGDQREWARLGEDYYGLTVSFSPKDRIPEARLRQGGYLQTLRNAGKAYPAHWPFLTGGDTAIRALADSLGFRYRYDKESEQYEHPAVSMILGPGGRISRYLYGVEFSPRELRLAVVEASQGKVGTAFDRVILRCFKYDPASRKYHFYVMGALRLGSGAFAVRWPCSSARSGGARSAGKGAGRRKRALPGRSHDTVPLRCHRRWPRKAGHERVLRRLLFLPDQASTFARDVDRLHYFVIITTFIMAPRWG